MKRKNGFTLIELLAVIVILAIIALIAVPTVMNIISRANKSAFKDSAYGVLKAGENYYMGELLNAQGMTSDKVFDFSKDTSELEINGSKPTNGKMIVNTNGKVAMAIHNGKHCVTKGFNDDDVTITDDVNNCKLPGVVTIADLATTGTFTSVDGTTISEVSEVDGCAESGICEAGTPFAIKVNENETYKFYVLSDTGSEVTLIMDRNLYSDTDENNGNVAWITANKYVSLGGTLYEDTYPKNDKGPLTALEVLNERTSGWTNIPAYTYILENDEDVKGGEYTYPDITGELVANVRARLPRYTELKSLQDSNDNNLPSYLLENTCTVLIECDTYGYMLSTAYSIDIIRAWCIRGFPATLTNLRVDATSYGLRPVITLSK